MAKLHQVTRQDGSPYGWHFWCPGCNDSHTVVTAGDHAWGFNGDPERPTFTPSYLIYGIHKPASETYNGQPYDVPRCHSFVTDGKIAFCSDSEHALAGQTVELPDWDNARR